MAIIPLLGRDVAGGEDGDGAGAPHPGDALPMRGVPSREAVPPHDEAQLARRLARGDSHALTAISEWLWDPLARYAYRITDERDAAMDIAQEALVRLWENRTSTPVGSLRPYLFRITRNLALDYVKTRNTRRRLLLFHRPGRSGRPRTPAEELESGHVSAMVHRAIQTLPARRKEVFTLAYLRGLSYADVGEVMGISPKTVHNQMTAALAELRQALAPLVEERGEHRTGRDEVDPERR